MRKATLVAALLLLTPTISEAKTLEELLVEKGVITRGEASGASESGASKVYWNRGTRVEFPDTGFTTFIATELQTRYEFTDKDEDRGDPNASSFTVNRARLIIEGTALNKEFSYRLSTDFISAADSDANFGASPSIRDAYIDWRPCIDDTGVRMGAFKTGISRQFNTNQSTMQFTDRSAASEYFTIGRQNGAMAYTALADGMVTGSAGIFNGESDGEGANSAGFDTRQIGVANLRVNPIGKMDVAEEGDIDWTEDAALSFGAAYAYSSAYTYSSEGDNSLVGVSRSITNIDANFKYMGWSLHSEYYFQDVQNSDSTSSSAFAAGKPSGFYAQGGYFLMPKKLELAARYGYIDCDEGTAGRSCQGVDNYNETAATINYYFWRHSLKAQLGYAFVQTKFVGDDIDDLDINQNRYVFQLSSYF